MRNHQVVNKEQWLNLRKKLLTKEKEFTVLRDQLSQQRREMPWVKIDKNYRFNSTQGTESLADLFNGKSQLIVYHFMFGPDWEQGCPSCSFWADNYDGVNIHLNHRDINLVTISRAEHHKLEEYKQRMGWNFKWVSSFGNDFNFDFDVSFKSGEQQDRYYNYAKRGFLADEAPGISVFIKNEEGEIFHSYSCYARGLDMLNGAYHLMDLTPKGRDEQDLPYSMAWVSRHDQYED